MIIRMLTAAFSVSDGVRGFAWVIVPITVDGKTFFWLIVGMGMYNHDGIRAAINQSVNT